VLRVGPAESVLGLVTSAGFPLPPAVGRIVLLTGLVPLGCGDEAFSVALLFALGVAPVVEPEPLPAISLAAFGTGDWVTVPADPAATGFCTSGADTRLAALVVAVPLVPELVEGALAADFAASAAGFGGTEGKRSARISAAR